MKKLLIASTLAVSSLLASATEVLAGSFFIDDFSQTQFTGQAGDSGLVSGLPNQDIRLGGAPPGVISGPPLPPSGPNPYQRVLDPASPGVLDGLLGASRNLEVELLQNGNAISAVRARTIPTTNSLAVSNISTATSEVTLLWNANNAINGFASTGQQDFLNRLGGVDPNNIDQNVGFFGIDFRTVRGSVDATLTVVTGTNSTQRMASITLAGLTGDTDQTQWNLKDFLDVEPLLDFTDVKYIQLVLNGPQGYAVDIDSLALYEIPEPSAVLGFLLLFGIGLTSRKDQDTEDK